LLFDIRRERKRERIEKERFSVSSQTQTRLSQMKNESKATGEENKMTEGNGGRRRTREAEGIVGRGEEERGQC